MQPVAQLLFLQYKLATNAEGSTVTNNDITVKENGTTIWFCLSGAQQLLQQVDLFTDRNLY